LKEEEEEKTLPTGQPPGETMTELLLKYQHQDWMPEELTPELKLRLKFYSS
jgi:hypothetical protein